MLDTGNTQQLAECHRTANAQRSLVGSGSSFLFGEKGLCLSRFSDTDLEFPNGGWMCALGVCGHLASYATKEKKMKGNGVAECVPQ